jgi:hypothetical protein
MGFNKQYNAYIAHTKSEVAGVYRATAVARTEKLNSGNTLIKIGVSLAHPQDEFVKEFGVKNALMHLEATPLTVEWCDDTTGKEIVLLLKSIAANVVIRAYTNQRPFIKL